MPIKSPNDIFNYKLYQQQCELQLQQIPHSTPIDNIRAALAPILSNAAKSGIEVIKQRFRDKPKTTTALQERSWLIDQIITLSLYLAVKIINRDIQTHLKAPNLSIIATGGYGRQELFFHSDIDVMLITATELPDDILTKQNHQLNKHTKSDNEALLISIILYIFWDIGLKIGYCVHSVNQAINAARSNHIICTNLLEARHVAGDKNLTSKLLKQFTTEIITPYKQDFITAKLAEWQKRQQKLGESRYILEPNIKEGKGGLRDLHLLVWLARYCFQIKRMRDLLELGHITLEELRDFRKCRKFLHIVRLHLHDIAGHAQERLTFDMQQEIAKRLQYRGNTANQAVERFMKQYFLTTKTVGRLTRNFYLLIAEQQQPQTSDPQDIIKLPATFTVKSHYIDFAAPYIIHNNPISIIEIFWHIHKYEMEIHPISWQQITRNLSLINSHLRHNIGANKIFLQILCDYKNPEKTLRRMNESGVLGKFIPEFGKIVGQIQFDLYHTYSVDEHIILAISILHQIEAGSLSKEFPLATNIFPTIKHRTALYVAMLCHDIAKGSRGDHSELGAKTAYKLAQRVGLNKTEQETAAWLVKSHLLMSSTAFKRDLQDNNTIARFVAEVNSLERLRLLLLLTVADIKAVGPNIWNGWKGQLLRELFYKAEHILKANHKQQQIAIHKLSAELQTMLRQHNPHEIQKYLQHADPDFIANTDIREHINIFPMWKKVANGKNFSLSFRNLPEQNITEMIIIAPDNKGLFAAISGVITIAGANIVHARIHTRKDNIVIDKLGLQDIQGKYFAEMQQQNKIKQMLAEFFTDNISLTQQVTSIEKRYKSASKTFSVTPKISIDNSSSKRYSIIEVHCLDRRGLLFAIATTLTALDIDIVSAHISTYGEVASDVFYVKDSDNNKITDQNRQQYVKKQLMAIL